MKIIYGNNSVALSGRIMGDTHHNPTRLRPIPNAMRWAGISRAFSPLYKHRVLRLIHERMLIRPEEEKELYAYIGGSGNARTTEQPN